MSHLEDLGEDGGCEEGGVLDDHIVALILVGDIELVQEVVRGLAHHHGAEELASQPCAAARSHALLNECHLQVGMQASVMCKASQQPPA